MEEFVPYDQSIQLREIGFDYKCLGVYHVNQRLDSLGANFLSNFPQTSNQDREDSIKAPLWQQAFRWFRDEHNLEPDIYWNQTGHYILFCYDVQSNTTVISHITMTRGTSYYNAQIELLNKLIEIVNNKLKQN